MKIIHTADWHLGNVFHGHSRGEEHRYFLSWLVSVIKERQPDVLIVAGDVFDTPNPSAEAEELYYNFLTEAQQALPDLQMVITAGNHDSAGRLDAPASLLRHHQIYVRGAVPLTEKGLPDFNQLILPLAPRGREEAESVVFAVPYLRGADYPLGLSPEEGLSYYYKELHTCLRKSAFRGLPIIAVSHFYARGASIAAEHSERLIIGGQEQVDAAVVGKGVAYTALGHLHRAQQVAGNGNTFYSGSALPMSFSERTYQHGVNFIELTDGEAKVERIAYTPLRRLISIPAQGEAIPAAGLPDALASLPARSEKIPEATWPYLEIRVLEKQPEPELIHQVMDLLAERAVCLCRITRQRGEDATGEPSGQATDSLQAIEPLRLARAFFAKRFGEEMPAPLVERFQKAEQEANCQDAQ